MDHWPLIHTLQVLLLLPLAERVYRVVADLRELLSPKTVIAGLCASLYVAGYYVASEYDRARYLTQEGYFMILLLAVMAYYGYVVGFAIGAGARTSGARPFRYRWACWYSLTLVGVGFAGQIAIVHKFGGFVAYYGEPHGQAGDWVNTSAYLYSLPMLIFPGAFLIYATAVRGGSVALLPRLALLVALLFYAFQAYMFGNRGDTIRLFLLLAIPLLLLRTRWEKARLSIVAAAIATVAVVLLFPFVREALYLGSEKSIAEAAAGIFKAPAVSLDYRLDSGHELFLGAALVEAVSAQRLYDLGQSWIYPFINMVPRAIWASKPYAAEWSIGVYNVLPQQHPGWVLYPGVFPTGVADTFVRFSWFGIVVWLLFGWWGGAIWREAATANGVLEAAYLWAYLVIMSYFVTQDFNGGWHAWLYYMMPIWVVRYMSAVRTSD